MPTVALASEFLDAFARLPRPQQRKVREFTEKFKADPTSLAINYEKLHGVRDDKIRTVRIDKKYRAVVLHPDRGDVYVLVWVDNHDEAMAWAARKSFEVNPVTGALQVVGVEEVERAAPTDDGDGPVLGLFAAYDDDVLLSFGVPAVLLPSVRSVRSVRELVSLGRHLPAEADEALLWLAEGIPPPEVREAVAVPAGGRVDPDDLAAALEHPDTRRRFVTIHSDDELAAMLEAPLEKWRVFLHPGQEKLVGKAFNGPARVLGGAGTGKTVVAMHRARHLAARVFTDPSDRILVTTYTANLAENIEATLKTFCGPERERVEVVHLHAWAVRLLRSHGVEGEIAGPEEIEQGWQEAITTTGVRDFDTAFLRKEWEDVVLAGGIEDRDAYLKVARLGRGKTLSRPQRGRAWQVFERYKESLGRRGLRDWLTVIREARRLLESGRARPAYRSVIVDEAQDFHPEEWRLIRSLAPAGPDDLFLVGDAHQRIYGPKVSLSRCGISIRGRSACLRINYRTTEQIRAWAMGVLRGVEADDLDEGRDGERGYRSLLSGSEPEVHHFGGRDEEREFLAATLRSLVEARQPEEVCLVARTNSLIRNEYAPLLKNLGIPHQILDRGRERPDGGIRLATMHRVKGLEFPVMVLAGLSARTMPLRVASLGDDPTALADHGERERSLLFVAATRARDRLIVTSFGTPSPFLGAMAEPARES
ncbi:UvrD-helicase domain-containing protein [Tautonia plasticadhaerens]|uniref:DNA 3'-5' helicase n=1 Tax=Tautonia plasticadhaerens TaxID=2527974 RepID=A0A518H9Z5_9BACT|nr:UvrD-helicase domain-containing protein [Tautonia plasticadhaerens]QDV37674.1 ATP-dependent DNA helicase PcrA [Tautonia plasticadhaerens]